MATSVVLFTESLMIKLANGAQENRENSIMRVKNDQCLCTLSGIWQVL